MCLYYVFITLRSYRGFENTLSIVNIVNHDVAGKNNNALAYAKSLDGRRAAVDARIHIGFDIS